MNSRKNLSTLPLSVKKCFKLARQKWISYLFTLPASRSPVPVLLLLCGCLGSLVAHAFTFTADGDFIYVNGKKTLIKGVAYSPFYPGESHADPPRKADIAKDMERIKALGANTIMLYWLRDETIYREAKRTGLYIIQGIPVDNNPEDFQAEGFKKSLKRRIRYLLKTLHDHGGTDYSDHILAYWIGGELDERAVLTTNRKHAALPAYRGRYVRAPDGANATESFLAEMADYLQTHAVDTFGEKPLVSHINWPSTDERLDISFMDIACFDVYAYWPDKVAEYLPSRTTGTAYQGYLQDLKKTYPDIPLIVSEFGYSTAPENPTDTGRSEIRQAVGLVDRWTDILTARPPLAGGLIFEWNDEWWKHSKAATRVPFSNDKFAHEKDDFEEWFGLVSIDGPSFKEYTVRMKPAYYAAQRMYKDDFDPERHLFKSLLKRELFGETERADLGLFVDDAERFLLDEESGAAFLRTITEHPQGPFAHLFIRIRNGRSLIKKEKERLAALIRMLHERGASVHYLDDGNEPKNALRSVRKTIKTIIRYHADVDDEERFDGIVIDYVNRMPEGRVSVKARAKNDETFLRSMKRIANDLYRGRRNTVLGLFMPADTDRAYLARVAEWSDYWVMNSSAGETSRLWAEVTDASTIACRYDTRVMFRASDLDPETVRRAIPEKFVRDNLFTGFIISSAETVFLETWEEQKADRGDPDAFGSFGEEITRIGVTHKWAASGEQSAYLKVNFKKEAFGACLYRSGLALSVSGAVLSVKIRSSVDLPDQLGVVAFRVADSDASIYRERRMRMPMLRQRSLRSFPSRSKILYRGDKKIGEEPFSGLMKKR